jgi:hypothetical protein
VHRRGRVAAARPARFTVALPDAEGVVAVVPDRRVGAGERVPALEGAG